MREYIGCPRSPHQVAFVPGNPPRLVAAANTAAYLWQPDRPDPVVLAWDETAWGEPFLECSPDGKWIVAGHVEHPRAWDLTVDLSQQSIRVGLPGVITARFAGDSNSLAFACKLRDPPADEMWTGKVPFVGRLSGVPREFHRQNVPNEIMHGIRSLNPASGRQLTAISADRRWLALSVARRAIQVWAIGSDDFPRIISLRSSPSAISFSPDGSRLLIDAGTTVYLYDTTTLEQIVKWKTKYSYVPGLAWSPDSQLLARTDRSTTVRMYEATSGRERMAIGTKRGVLISAAFSPDGLTVATGTYEGPVRVWDVE